MSEKAKQLLDRLGLDVYDMLPIGAVTKFGRVAGVSCVGGDERQYFILSDDGTVSLMPASVVEPKE